MKALAVAVLLSATVLVQQVGSKGQAMRDASTETYEHLANVIIELRATEEHLVESILVQHHVAASHHLQAASDGEDVRRHLEAAAQEIANIANEGDKPIQAIRQRLLKAGHHHHSDAETKDDYILIDSKEKGALLALSGRVGQMAGAPSAADIGSASNELDRLFAKAIAPD